jgi:hypothetical protein
MDMISEKEHQRNLRRIADAIKASKVLSLKNAAPAGVRAAKKSKKVRKRNLH